MTATFTRRSCARRRKCSFQCSISTCLPLAFAVSLLTTTLIMLQLIVPLVSISSAFLSTIIKLNDYISKWLFHHFSKTNYLLFSNLLI